MCKLKIKIGPADTEFVIYNHLFAKRNVPFSVRSLQNDLKKYYDLDINEKFIQAEIDEYLDSGLVIPQRNKYLFCVDWLVLTRFLYDWLLGFGRGFANGKLFAPFFAERFARRFALI